MNAEVLTPEERIARWRRRVLETIHTARLTIDVEAAASIQPNDDSALLARSGWRSLREGEIEMARACFRAALHYDPYAVSAWLGLSRAVEDRALRRAYLQAALDLQLLLTETFARDR